MEEAMEEEDPIDLDLAAEGDVFSVARQDTGTTSTSAAVAMPESLGAFCFEWELNKARSDDTSEHLKAIGVPWAVRLAMARTSNVKDILVRSVTASDDAAADAAGEPRRDRHALCWVEKTTTKLMSKTQELWLDRREQRDTHPLDGSIVTIVSWAEQAPKEAAASAAGAAGWVVHSEYHYVGLGVRQHIERRIENGGATYRVINTMRQANESDSAMPQIANIVYDRATRA